MAISGPGPFLASVALVAGLSGCASTTDTIALVGGATALGGQAPTHEIEQIYYLGVFDPADQVPPAVYRVRVRGQASFISQVKFASGWVPAHLVDSLGTSISFTDSGDVTIGGGADGQLSKLKTGRRLVMFGPEGFREAPADHRLAVVMGASPEAFFNAIDTSLATVSKVQAQQRNSALDRALFRSLVKLKSDRDRLDEIAKDVDARLPATP